jgi:2-C-methyl-D-erythritol 4-phosphate cytidylyltransferase
MKKKEKISVIILAGGQGTRMQTSIPKQFLELDGKPVAWHSFHLFLDMPQIDEIVIVCAESYQHLFTQTSSLKKIHFAQPGNRRQDSVYNGLLAASPNSELICIHDAARPFINSLLVIRALEAAQQYGAAAVGMPLKFTIKETCNENKVKSTPKRSTMWEIQTPQVVKREILHNGFLHANMHDITVTDDVSLAELIGHTVKIVEGEDTNIKITLPSDLLLAKLLLSLRNCKSDAAQL